jgi:acyl-CoA hydrolase
VPSALDAALQPPFTREGVAALRAGLSGAREIYVSGCSVEIAGLRGVLNELGIAGTITSILSPPVNHGCYASNEMSRSERTFFLNRRIKAEMRHGGIMFCPWSYSQIARWLSTPWRFDAAVVMISPPDKDGMCSLGPQADFLPTFYDKVGALIGVVNPAMPRTGGDALIPYDRFAATFVHESRLLEMSATSPGSDPAIEAIAGYIGELVPDGATIQMGLGKVPSAVGAALRDHRRLRIHSGLIDDNTLLLEDAGALDQDCPIVSGVAIGTRQLFDRIDGDPRFVFRSVGYTHDPVAIGRIPNFMSINGALQVDLFGQLNSEGIGGGIMASPGGLPEFSRGANLSQGGRAIVSLKAGRGSRAQGGIVACVAEPGLVTAPRVDIDVVVTEFGVARLRDLSLEQRAQALIAIADPIERDMLANSWRGMMQKAFP